VEYDVETSPRVRVGGSVGNMSVFKRLLAKAGIGGAKVDFQPERLEAAAGGQISGKVRLQGGIAEQRIGAFEIRLYAEYKSFHTDAQGQQSTRVERALINTYSFPYEALLKPSEAVEEPVALLMPLHTPLTLTRERVWFQTSLAIEAAADPTDQDAIQVLPDPLMKRVLQAMERYGFEIVRSDLIASGDEAVSPDPFIQRIFYRASNEYRLLLDEIVMTPVWGEDALLITLAMNKKAGIIRTIAGSDIVTENLVFPVSEWETAGQQELEQALKSAIDKAAAETEA
jgi:sporulation-control protein